MLNRAKGPCCRVGVFFLISACTLSVTAAPISSPSVDPHLALGMKQVEEGEFETAVYTLDGVVRRLSPLAEKRQDLVMAYVYLGSAFLGLDHEKAAKAKFREALRLDPELRLDPAAFTSRVIALFESEALRLKAAKTKHSAKKYLIIGGLGAATAVGIALGTRGSAPTAPGNRPPTVTVAVSPGEQGTKAILGITVMHFTASANDPDGDALSYKWDFGDGASGSGSAASHIYSKEGTFTARVTASDSKGGKNTADVSVTAQSLTGSWYYESGGTPDRSYFSCVQKGATLECQLVSITGRLAPDQVGVIVADPHLVVGGFYNRTGTRGTVTHGSVKTDLSVIQVLTVENYGFPLRRQ